MNLFLYYVLQELVIKLGEYIKEHKESFIEKDDENEKRISE